MKIQIWHSIEQRTTDASIYQWHTRFKTCMSAFGTYVPRADILTTCNKLICVDKTKNSIPGEHKLKLNVFASL